MKALLFLMAFLFSNHTFSSKEVLLGRKYFQKILGHVHKHPSRDSSSLTVVQCSHSVKILASKKTMRGWSYVQVGEDRGFIESSFLGEKRPICFQQKYPYFYRALELDITEMYFWGRLYDHYLEGRTRVR